jgi:hypothetical protein
VRKKGTLSYRKRTFGVLAFVIVACSAPTRPMQPQSHPMESDPHIDVEIDRSQEQIVFLFRSCHPRIPRASVHTIYLTSTTREGPGDREVLVCSLKPKVDDGEHVIGETWKLGYLPPGYDGPGCGPGLVPGTYGIHVDGVGSGGGFFEIDANRAVTWLTEPRCGSEAEGSDSRR